MSETTETGTADTDAGADKTDDVKAATVLSDDKTANAGDQDKGADASADDQTKDEGAEGKDEDADGDKSKSEGAPDEYEAFTLPEGVEVDEAALAEFLPVAKELNLSQEQAQKLVDLQAANVAKMAEAQQKVWADTQDKWVADAKADKEIGGDKFDENVGVAKKALAEFGTPELTAALAMTGAGNHPEFIRFCARVGKAISEDKLVTASNGGGKKEAADLIYDKSVNKTAT